MRGGTLAVSREIINHSYYKEMMERLGFTDVHVTDADKDALAVAIQEMKPDALVMGSRFYQCATPYMMGLLHRQFPKLYLAAVGIGEYPAELGMYFILNGVNCYVSTCDGIGQFYEGLEAIRDRRRFVPLCVQERIDARKEYPASALMLTETRREVLRCICNGFSKEAIADNLAISGRTVENHRKELYRSLNARNTADLFVAALTLGIVTSEELVFKQRDFTCTPLPGI